MAIARWKTAGEIINAAAIELSLGSLSDPLASQDQNFKLLVQFLNSTGQELTRKVKPIREATLTIAPGDTGLYSVPDDFVGMQDQSGWNRTSRYPLIGPDSSQTWSAIKATGITGTLYARFRLVQGQVELMTPLPAVGTVLALEYISKAWVQSNGGTSPDKDAATLSTDYVLYDPLLMQRAVKFHWKAAKGFDSAKEQDEYESLLASVMTDSVGAPILSMAGPRGPKMISGENAGETGFGQ